MLPSAPCSPLPESKVVAGPLGSPWRGLTPAFPSKSRAVSAVTPLPPRLCSSLLPVPHLSWGEEEYGQAQAPASPPDTRGWSWDPWGGDLGFTAVWRFRRGILQSTRCKGLPRRIKLLPQGHRSFEGLQQRLGRGAASCPARKAAGIQGSRRAWAFRDHSRSRSRAASSVNQASLPMSHPPAISHLGRLEMLQIHLPSFWFSFAKFTTK